jgi:hypothetical protein
MAKFETPLFVERYNQAPVAQPLEGRMVKDTVAIARAELFFGSLKRRFYPELNEFVIEDTMKVQSDHLTEGLCSETKPNYTYALWFDGIQALAALVKERRRNGSFEVARFEKYDLKPETIKAVLGYHAADAKLTRVIS